MAEYQYSKLENVAVDIVDDAITLNMRTSSPEEQKSFNFDTRQKEDIANLIASYSPIHSNWQKVGEAKTKLVSDSLLQMGCICLNLDLCPPRSVQQRRIGPSCGRRCGHVGKLWLWNTRCYRNHQRRGTSSPPPSESEHPLLACSLP